MSENMSYNLACASRLDVFIDFLKESRIDAILDLCEQYDWLEFGAWDTRPAAKRWLIIDTEEENLKKFYRGWEKVISIEEATNHYWQLEVYWNGNKIQGSWSAEPLGRPNDGFSIEERETLTRFFGQDMRELARDLAYDSAASFCKTVNIPYIPMLDLGKSHDHGHLKAKHPDGYIVFAGKDYTY